MTDKPTGVFVRFPLDEAQIMKLYNPKKSGNENLLAIGTPVTGGELDVVAYADPSDLPLNDGTECNWYAEVAGKTEDECTEGLVRQSDALAKLAEKDAEIARLRTGLARIEQQADEYPGDDASALGWIVSECEALKDPEA